MASHLSSGRINLGCLRELARKELLQCLLKCHGTKALVWDDQLTGPFGLFAEYSLLKDHDVIKMFTLRPGHLPQVNVQHFIFLTRASLSLMGIIAENIHNEEKNKDVPQKEFHMFFVPRKSFLCDQKLQDLGVYGNFTSIRDINVELYPYDSDLMTMELDAAFRECHLEGDMTSMYHVAKSLMTIQALFGIIPNVYGKGKCAKLVYDLMVRMRRELSGQEPQITSQIDALLLIDREVDLLSPLITQLTYEGLIDEIFGINSTIVKLPPEKFVKESDGGPSEMPTEPKEFLLNSSDELYSELRRCNFSAVGTLLSKKAKAISAQYEERHGAKTVSEIKQFVAKLPHMQAAKQSLTMHTAISELIKEVTDSDDFLDTLHIEHDFVNTIDTEKPHPYIEECIAKQEPLIKVLRLICIQSITNSGLKSKTLDYYKRDILHTYGYEHILTLQNLEAVGLLKLQDQRPYQVLRKALRLTEEAVDEQNPNDIAFVHSGYAPLSVRLAQFLARSGWKSIPDALRLLPGPQIEEYQPVPLGLRKRRGSGSSIQSSTDEQKVTLVFFLGGCTYAEIAALRFLSMQEDYPTEYVIATTKVINGKTFIESLMENLEMQSNIAT